MARIQSNIGLVTGIPIGDLVDQLMEIAARPRSLLIQRTEKLQKEQVAVTELTAMLLSVQYATNYLGNASVYEQRRTTSSDPAILAVTSGGSPPIGTYQFTPLRTAQSQQWLSAGVRDSAAALGGGTMTFRFGDHVQRSTPLELWGGGEGIARGKIRITDRSGAWADIDLSTARTLADVLEAISGNAAINVTAVARGDGIRLIDNTGQALSNLVVEEVGGGTTAASLGLAGINVAASTADGQDVIRLYEDLDLAVLNDGNGVVFNRVLPDVGFKLSDGTEGSIDFWRIIQGGSEVEKQFTLGDVIETINAAAPDKLRAKISDDGDRLVVEDLTGDVGDFELFAINDSDALRHLGLDRAADQYEITGRRLLGGAQSVLVSSLGGGQGFGEMGQIEITDRAGTSRTINLAGAETLEEIVDRINASDVNVLARIYKARNGIEIVDASGSQAGNLVVADVDDGTETATKLGIAVDDAVASVNSGDMHLQVVSRNTLLSSLGGGRGVARGTLSIDDSLGKRATLDLRGESIQTVGDVIDAINRLNVGVFADLNDTGDGIRIRDTAGGSGTLAVGEGDTTTARDLALSREAATVELGGQPTQVIDGSMTHRIELDENDSLADLLEKINELGAGVTATTFLDGTSRPYRLALNSQQSGRQGALVIDTSQLGLDFQQTVRAQDALLLFGDPSAAATGILASSSSNRFQNVLPDATLDVKQANGQSVAVTVEPTDTNLVAAVRSLADMYNKFRGRLTELTEFNTETNERALLTGDTAALRLDAELSHLMSGLFLGAGSIRSLAEVGLTLKQDGTLEFDEQKLRDAYAANPEAVRTFFTQADSGVSDRFKNAIDQFTAQDYSLLTQRYKTLTAKIEKNEERIEAMTKRLDVERDRLLLQLYRMEIAIGKMQSQLSAVEAIQPLAPLSTTQRQR